MTKIKLCGLRRQEDILAVNRLLPEYIGFVFFQKSKRYVSPKTAKELKARLSPEIRAVGVFVDEDVDTVAELLRAGIIDIAQLHGHEDEDYIRALREKSSAPIIKAFRIASADDIEAAKCSAADYILLDSGAGTGNAFDWTLIRDIGRPYFLAGGLDPENVTDAVRRFSPYAVDTSSGIETDGFKDEQKMAAFTAAVRSRKETDQ